MLQIKFGTDGWRAIIARDFTFENCRLVAQGIAGFLSGSELKKRGIVIGYDNRFMAEDFAAECARVLVGNGIKVHFFRKAAPTPLVAFAIRHLDAGGAIMITASHNPSRYCGIKFIPQYAGPALPEETEAIEAEIQKVQESGKVYELDTGDAAQLDLFQEIDLDREYSRHLLELVHREAFAGHKLKVVIDPMYGAGAGYLEQLLGELGCEVRSINSYRDPLFGGSMPEPVDDLLSDLKRAVTSYEADVGLALDGDADRFGLVDEEGQFISANRFMYLLLDYLLKTRTFRGPVCRTLATTHMLDRVARKHGLQVIETPVGFKYVGQALREKGCILGGEESGGLSIFGHVPEKDGILACLLAAEMLAGSGKTFSELEQDFMGRYGTAFSRRTDLRVTEEERDIIADRLQEYQPVSVAGAKVQAIDRREGTRISLEDGSWVLVRASGTEPLFRVYVEAASQGQLADIEKAILADLELKTD